MEAGVATMKIINRAYERCEKSSSAFGVANLDFAFRSLKAG